MYQILKTVPLFSGRVKTLPYKDRIHGLEFVGAIINRLCCTIFRVHIGFPANTAGYAVRAVEGAGPYNYEIGASENVGGGALDAPCSIFPFPHRLSANTEQYAVWEGQDPPLL